MSDESSEALGRTVLISVSEGGDDPVLAVVDPMELGACRTARALGSVGNRGLPLVTELAAPRTFATGGCRGGRRIPPIGLGSEVGPQGG